MGASWLEIDKLIGEVETLTQFPHAEALAPVTRARDVVAETAMVVALAGLSEETRAESEAQDLLARARVAVLEARTAVERAAEAVAQSRASRARAQTLVAEARALRARDRGRASMAVGRATGAATTTALARVVEPASAS